MKIAPRVVRHLATALAGLMLLAACGGGAPSSETSGPTGKGPIKGQVRFSWWGTGERNQKTMQVITLFQNKYPDATVQGEPVGDFTTYWQKLTVQASAQNLPCIPQMQVRYLDQYDRRHTLLALDSLVQSGAIDVSGIPSVILNAGRGPDGKLYMVPTGSATNAWMYNTTMAQKAGLPPLSPNMTWEQVQSWLLEAKSKLPEGVYPIDLRGGDDSVWIAWVLSHGQKLFKDGKLAFSKQMMIDYWNWWEKLRKAGATVSASMRAEEPADNQQGYITLGKVLMDERPPNQVGAIQAPLTAANRGVLELVTFPKGPNGNGMVVVNSGMSISANCNNIPVAAAWVNFFANDSAGAKAYASSNGAVTVTKLLNEQISDPTTSSYSRQNLSFLKQIIGQKPTMVDYPSGYGAVIDSLARNYTNVSFGRATVQQAVDTFFSEANSSLSQ